MKVLALVSALTFLNDALPVEQVDEALCLTEIVHYEANGEGWEGKKAVANTALNRAEEGNVFPTGLCPVLKQRAQFSHRREGLSLKDVVITQPDDLSSFRETLALVERAMTIGLKDNTLGADHFFNPAYVQPAWGRNPITQVQIGNHRFVKVYP